jgi:hypothetical protein
MSMCNALNGSQPDAGAFKRLRLNGSFSKFLVEGANILLPPLALGDVIVR